MRAPEMLKRWRAKRKLTQQAAAELAGVRQATWCDWENGKKTPRVDAVLRLSRITAGFVSPRAWEETAVA